MGVSGAATDPYSGYMNHGAARETSSARVFLQPVTWALVSFWWSFCYGLT